MTHVTNPPEDTWSVAEAKARFSEVLERAQKRPQIVTRHGRTAAVIVAPEEWERKKARVGTLADFLAASPLRGSGLLLERTQEPLRDPGL